MKRRILPFSLFEAAQAAAAPGLTPEQEKFLNKHTKKRWFKYNSKGEWRYDPATGLVDVEGFFDIKNQNLGDFKGIKFGKVLGFDCSENNLTSLEGAPQKVIKNFDCNKNKLTSLKGSPQEVGGDFDCSFNKSLTSLDGAPQKVGGSFECVASSLTSLKEAPEEVGNEFDCGGNKLTSLEGAPQIVGGNFDCAVNQLTSLEGAPQSLKGYFFCFSNALTSLKGAPQEVGGDFICAGNPLTSLKGAPKEIGGKFDCQDLELELDAGQWNPKGWTRVLVEGSPKAKELIRTIFSAEALNPEIQKDPAGMMIALKSLLKDPEFSEITSKLVWPKGYEDEVELVGGLSSLGF